MTALSRLSPRARTLLVLLAVIVVAPALFPSTYYYRVGVLIFINGLAVTGLVDATGRWTGGATATGRGGGCTGGGGTGVDRLAAGGGTTGASVSSAPSTKQYWT